MKIEQPKKYVPSYLEDSLFFNLRYKFWSKYPYDYLIFIKDNGEGIIGNYINIYAPDKAEFIEKRWKETSAKSILKKHFPDNNHFISNSLFIGDTLDSDQIFYYDGFYYAYSYQGPVGFLEKTGKNLTDVFKFYNSGKYWESIDTSLFTPYNSSWFFHILEYFNIHFEINDDILL